ncbi:hypothetical protein ACFWUU_12775 [Kribbella sp. NPDC058693]|uniref:hypothetical protein n=1 Tax=Kribbella sp. NPDC058693 TaxID=3346602 RepID=UPI003647A6A2
MVDEVISVSAASLLGRANRNLQDALEDLDGILQTVGSSLAGPEIDGPPGQRPASFREALESTQLDLIKLLGRLRSTSDILQVLTPTKQASTTPRLSADQPGDAQESSRTVPLAGVSVTTLHRMTEIQDSLKLTEQEAFERCVATQAYVDDRLRGGWRFFVTRGRERRSVSFPGQQAV